MSGLSTLPCPFCGLDDTYLVRPDQISETALVGCNACGAIGPVTYQQSVDEAIKRWNTRPHDHYCRRRRNGRRRVHVISQLLKGAKP